MKVTGGVTQTQVVEGSITKQELLALVRETLHIPEGATARFHAQSGNYSLLMNQQHGMQPLAQLVDVTDDSPLRFRITWEIPVAQKQG